MSGPVRLVVDVDAGTVARRIDCDGWGNAIGDSSAGFQPFGFAGGLYDPLTKLVHFGAREYDAVTGRWTRADPILFDGGDANLYGYATGDPVNAVDPSGLDVWLAGPSGWNEPGGHMNISIGDPSGFYDSYSFGAFVKKHPFGGPYEDTAYGGRILSYLRADSRLDGVARRLVLADWDSDGEKWYGREVCFGYSAQEFAKIKAAGWEFLGNPQAILGYPLGSFLSGRPLPMGGLFLEQ